jgi:hypothetical protein
LGCHWEPFRQKRALESFGQHVLVVAPLQWGFERHWKTLGDQSVALQQQAVAAAAAAVAGQEDLPRLASCLACYHQQDWPLLAAQTVAAAAAVLTHAKV